MRLTDGGTPVATPVHHAAATTPARNGGTPAATTASVQAVPMHLDQIGKLHALSQTVDLSQAHEAVVPPKFPNDPGHNSALSALQHDPMKVAGSKIFTGPTNSGDGKIFNSIAPSQTQQQVASFIDGSGLRASMDGGLDKQQQNEYEHMSVAQRTAIAMRQLGPSGFSGFLGEEQQSRLNHGQGLGADEQYSQTQSNLQRGLQSLVSSGTLTAADAHALAAAPGYNLRQGDYGTSMWDPAADSAGNANLVGSLGNDPKSEAFKNAFVAGSYDAAAQLGGPDSAAAEACYAGGTHVLASEGSDGMQAFLHSAYGSPNSLTSIVNGSIRGEANIYNSSLADSGYGGSPYVSHGSAQLIQQIADDAKGAPVNSAAAQRAAGAFAGFANATTGVENDIIKSDAAGSGLRVAAANLFHNAFPAILQQAARNNGYGPGTAATGIDCGNIGRFLQCEFTPQYQNAAEARQIGSDIGAPLGAFSAATTKLAQSSDSDYKSFERTYGDVFGPNEKGNDPAQNAFYAYGQILGEARSQMKSLNAQVEKTNPSQNSSLWQLTANFITSAAGAGADLGLSEVPVVGPALTAIKDGGDLVDTAKAADELISAIGGSTHKIPDWQNTSGLSQSQLDEFAGNRFLQGLYNGVAFGPTDVAKYRYYFDSGIQNYDNQSGG